MKKNILVTHNGSFHADDVFACAALTAMLDRIGEQWEIIRTRDEEEISKGDYVFDVGGIYDPTNNRFDHHQSGGAGKRENGIDYASFGLVWKKFGEQVSGNAEVAELVDRKLVQPIDALDNGVDLVKLTGEVKPYFIQEAFKAFHPNWKNSNEESLYRAFLECVEFGKKILLREVDHETAAGEAKSIVRKFYMTAENRQIIILDHRYPWQEELASYPEPLYVISPRGEGKGWGVECVPQELFSFEVRKKLPAAWAGLRDVKLAKVSGVPDAVFCHRGLFMAVARSSEGAIALANLAIRT